MTVGLLETTGKDYSAELSSSAILEGVILEKEEQGGRKIGVK